MSKIKKCVVETCHKSAGVKFKYCYDHRKWGHSAESRIIKTMNRFYCAKCGSVSFSKNLGSCHLCGGMTELIKD